MKKMLLITTIMICFNIVIAKTWYVSEKGDNNNRGDKNCPFLTIQRGADKAQPGDTIFVMKGVYRERVSPPRGGTKQAPIVYYAESGRQVFIKGSDIYQNKLIKISNNVFSCNLSKMEFTDDFYFDNANPFKVPTASTPWMRDGAPEGNENIVFSLGQVFINGKQYKQFPREGEMYQHRGSWWYDIKNNNVLIHFDERHDPQHSKVELTTRRRIFAPHKRGLGYIHVIGFIMEHCGNQYPRNFWRTKENTQAGALGIRSGHHWLIKNNVVRYAANAGIDCGTEGPDNERLSQRIFEPEEVVGNRIENNYILDNGCAGIIGWGSKDMVVKGNVVMYNNNQMYRGYKRYESAGLKFHNNINCRITNNLISDNFAYGVWFDNKYPNARVSKNLIVNNFRSGIFLEMGDYDFGTVLIDHNVIMNNIENQIYIHDASGGLFLNNLISGTRKVRIKDKENRNRYGQAVYIRQVQPRTKTYHHAFYNNIFCDNDIIYDINYPMWRSGEQRFLGNVYENGKHQNRLLINSASDIPKPIDRSTLKEKVAYDLDVKVEKVHTSEEKVTLDFKFWKKFWKVHSMHFDQDANVISDINATYLPQSQSIKLYLSKLPCLNNNSRWNVNYKYRFDLKEKMSFPGPFGKLKMGDNEYILFHNRPSIKRGELPSKYSRAY